MGVTRIFNGTAIDASGNQVYDAASELLHWKYDDNAAGGANDVLIASRTGDGSAGLINTAGLIGLVVTLKNLDATGVTWESIPKFRGSNDPLLVTPTVTTGFDLDIGDNKAVDKAFGTALATGEEQEVVIDCSKAPNCIFLIADPPAQNIDLDIFVRALRK